MYILQTDQIYNKGWWFKKQLVIESCDECVSWNNWDERWDMPVMYKYLQVVHTVQ